MVSPHIDDSKLSMHYGAYRFQPVPFMSYGQEPLVNDAGLRLADTVTLTFTGKLLNLADMASGDAAAMIGVRDTLINALSGNGNEFKLLHHINSTELSGTPILSGIYPRIEGLQFNEGTWVNDINYSFDFVYETNFVSGQVPIKNYSDDWDYEEDENNRVIRIKHSANAEGINTTISGGDSNAVVNAKTWVVARMGAAALPAGFPAFADSGTIGAFSLQRYRTEAISLTAGTYAATEDITMASGAYADSWSAQFQQDEQGITVLSINGSIEGLGRFDTAINNAVSGWNNDVQPKLSGLAYSIYNELGGSSTLNLAKVQSLSVTRDTYNGRVGYSVSYNDNPLDNLPSGIAEFSISKQIKLPIRKKAIFEIPSRIAGSIVHDIGTPTDGQIALNGTAQGVVATQLNYVKSYCEDQVNSMLPNAALYNQLWLTNFDKTENEDQKSFSFSIGWAYTDSLASVPDPSGGITF